MTRRKHISTTARRDLFLAANGRCTSCSLKIQAGQGWQLDHVVPLELGGDDEPANWQVLCVPCHRAKTKTDVSVIRKAQRREAAHIGARAPSRNPLPFGRTSRLRKKLDGSVVPR